MNRMLVGLCLLGICLGVLFWGPSIAQPADIPGAGEPIDQPPGPMEPLRAGLWKMFSETGQLRVSVDAFGSLDSQGLLIAEKPLDGSVVAAFLGAASTGRTYYNILPDEITLAGVPLGHWSMQLLNDVQSINYFRDVTDILAPVLNAAPPGEIAIPVTEANSAMVDGTVLAVVFRDPNLTRNFTVEVMFGAIRTSGDYFDITLPDPVPPLPDPNYVLDLSLGISYSYQVPDWQVQATLINVDGVRLTSSSGGQDDGEPENGALITAGGIGDSNDNPPDPYSPPLDYDYDDELYNLKPFLTEGETVVNIQTGDPSDGENIFFGTVLVSGAEIVNEVVMLAPETAVHCPGETHVVTAMVLDDAEDPIGGRTVDFEVLSGPHAGATGSGETGADGTTEFSYIGDLPGTDEIQAWMTDSSGATVYSNVVTAEWLSATAVEPSTWGGMKAKVSAERDR